MTFFAAPFANPLTFDQANFAAVFASPPALAELMKRFAPPKAFSPFPSFVFPRRPIKPPASRLPARLPAPSFSDSSDDESLDEDDPLEPLEALDVPPSPSGTLKRFGGVPDLACLADSPAASEPDTPPNDGFGGGLPPSSFPEGDEDSDGFGLDTSPPDRSDISGIY